MYDSESSSEAGWIEWFCDLEGHEFFVAVSSRLNSLIFISYQQMIPNENERNFFLLMLNSKFID